MENPTIRSLNVETGETTERQMTEEEYAALIQYGWTGNPVEEPTE